MMRVKLGDRQAFAELFDWYFAAVVRFLGWMVHDGHRAEDLAQDVFLNLYRSRERYQPRTSFRNFLYRIATNAAISEQRRRSRHGRVWRLVAREAFDPSHSGHAEVIEDHVASLREDSVETQIVERERIERFWQALNQLPARQQAALLLARAEGLSYQQVAEVLGVSVSAVKSLVHRATEHLRRVSKGEEP